MRPTVEAGASRPVLSHVAKPQPSELTRLSGVSRSARVIYFFNRIKFKKWEVLLENLISAFPSDMERSSIAHVLAR